MSTPPSYYGSTSGSSDARAWPWASCGSSLLPDSPHPLTSRLTLNSHRAGTGTAGVVFPLILSSALSRYGFRTVLRASAVAFLVLFAPLVPFLKPRLPLPATYRPAPLSLTFLATPAFQLLQTSNILQSLGYFLPSIYLPTIAHAHFPASATSGALLLILLNLAAASSSLLVGLAVDAAPLSLVLAAVSLAAAVATLAIWGTAHGFAALCGFAILYGASAGAYSTLWSGMIAEVRRATAARGAASVDGGMVFSLLAAGRGVGAVVSGPLSEALLKGRAAPSAGAAIGLSGPFAPLIVWTGVTAVLGGLASCGRWRGWIR